MEPVFLRKCLITSLEVALSEEYFFGLKILFIFFLVPYLSIRLESDDKYTLLINLDDKALAIVKKGLGV